MGGTLVNQALVRHYLEARDQLRDPVAAWAELTGNPELYPRARGRRPISLDDETAAELTAAAFVHTIATHGPDRVAAVAGSAMSRLVGRIGGAVLSEQPVAPAQILGPGFRGPEQDDWARAAYVLLWGQMRHPGAAPVIAGRYKGQKIVAIGQHPTRLSDETLVVRGGTDAALAMAMGHVLLKEFYVDRPVFVDHAIHRTDLPFLVRLRERGGAYVVDRVLDVGDGELSMYGGECVEVLLPRFDEGPGVLRRGVPVGRVDDEVVTTVFDLLLAVYGVAREGVPGSWPSGYDDRREPYTPGWQEPITGVTASRAVKLAREFGVTAEKTGGRCMIMPGHVETAHADTVHRALLALLVLGGCPGGWTQPVLPGAIQVEQYLYLHTSQDDEVSDVGGLGWALGEGVFAGRSQREVLLEAVRNGLPMAPQPRVLTLARPLDRLPAGLDLLIGPSEHADLTPPDVRLVAEAFDKLAIGHLDGTATDTHTPQEPGGRARLFADHEWMRECGEALPTYRPPACGPSVKPTVMVRW